MCRNLLCSVFLVDFWVRGDCLSGGVRGVGWVGYVVGLKGYCCFFCRLFWFREYVFVFSSEWRIVGACGDF